MIRRTWLGAAAAAALAAGAASRATAAPSLDLLVRHGEWLAGRPTAADFHRKVVLVDVFTFGCFNCKNITPNLRSLYRTRPRDLAIVGIHTPETPYETQRDNVVTNLEAQGIRWPVALDNDRSLWTAFGIEYWPTQLMFDKSGILRKTVIGDSQDDAVNAAVARLLAET